MRKKNKQGKTTWPRYLVFTFVLVATFLLLLSLGLFDGLVKAQGGPVLEVSKSFSGKPLLGGNATVSITIKNIGDGRGYNLSLEDVFSSADPDQIPHVPPKTIDFVSVSSSTGDAMIYAVSKDTATGKTTTRMSWSILCLKGCG